MFVDLWQWVQTLGPDNLPPEPWCLHPRQTVLDNRKFLTFLQVDAGRGQAGPRAKTGALQQDMRRLLEIATDEKRAT